MKKKYEKFEVVFEFYHDDIIMSSIDVGDENKDENELELMPIT